MSKKGRRKRPGKHTVHTKDSRYKVPSYPRGKGDLVTRHGVTKTQHAWDVDDGMVASPVYDRPTDEWRGDHNRSDVVDVDYHPSEASPEVVESQLRRYRIWLKRYYSAGMRDPENPSKTLPPSHPLTKLRTERIKTEIKYYEGKLTTSQYQRKIEEIEKRESRLKAPKSKRYIFYEDPGHGWLKVSLKELKALGIEDQISSYSYKRGKFAYLEEDTDASVFIKALKAKGVKVEFDHHIAGRSSRIRGYSPYKKGKDSFMIIRKAGDEWINLYPAHKGELPPKYSFRKEAEAHAKRLEKNMGLETRVLPASEALKFEIPKRW